MGQFRRKPLGVLDRIYGFLSGKTTISQVSLEAPATLVHDLSRQAERGAGYGQHGGYVIFNGGNTHAGAGTLRSQYDPYYYCLLGIDPVYAPVESEVDIWLAHLSVTFGDTDGNAVGIAMSVPVNGVLPCGAESTLGLFYGTTPQIKFSNYSATGGVYGMADTEFYSGLDLPIYLPHSCRITLQSVATNTWNVQMWVHCWVMPRGATPPGRQ